MHPDHRTRALALLQELVELFTTATAGPEAQPVRDTPLPLKPTTRVARQTPAISAEHRAQREYLIGWFQSHGCRVVARRQRWTTLADPSGCHWQVATWRVFRLDGKTRTHDLDALVLYALIGSGREIELRPATLTAVLPTYGRVANQLVRVDASGRYRG